MKACKHLDYDETKYTNDIKIVEVPGFSCRVRYWERGPVWTEGLGNEGNPKKVQFCGQGRGRINGVFQCYNPGEMQCHETEEKAVQGGDEWVFG